MKKFVFITFCLLTAFFFSITTYSSEKLFAKCSGCHGKDGSKHALGVSNPLKGQSKEEIIKKLNGYKNGTYGGSKKRMMESQAKRLSKEDIEKLAEYISKLQ
ncbi:c-type cytochrome [Deferribacter thermophilus]|uniref:c-type cytochrome n=1 Tax=Deferribacter thermophilus TaxID=53573 RepID=UPI003C256E34